MMNRTCAILITFLTSTVVSHSAPVTGGATRNWEARSQDTVIEFSIKGGIPVITRLQWIGSPADSHNWATSSPETVLPTQVEILGEPKTVEWRFSAGRGFGNVVIFTYKSTDGKLVLTSTWLGSDLPGPIRHRVSLASTDGHDILMPPVPTMSLALAPPGTGGLTHWWVEKGAGRPSSQGTHTEVVEAGYSKTVASGPHSADGSDRDAIPWFCLHDDTGKRGVYGGIEFSGWTEISVNRSSGRVNVSLGLQKRDDNSRILVQPRRMHGSATGGFADCFVGVYKGEVDDGCNRLHRWVESAVRPEIPGGVTPLLVNNSWGSGMAVDEQLARRMIESCAELGMEVFHIDAGWYREVGDWRPRQDKFPNGLDVVADYAHSKGLKFGLWVAWTNGGSIKNAESNVLSVFNEAQRQWFTRDYGDDWRNSAWTGAPVCLGSEQARNWCLDELWRIVKDYKLDLLEHDQVIIVDDCVRDGHGHVPGDPVDTSRAAADGYYQVYDTLRRLNPNLWFENCVSGGRTVDFGIAGRCHYICSTDVYDPLSLRQAFYDTSFPLPPSMIEGYIGNHPGNTIASFKYMLRSAMLGWCTIMTDTTKWSAEQRSVAKQEFELYKTLLRPLIASANLYHVLPRPDGKSWDGIQYFDPESNRGALFVFRPDCEEDTKAVRLKGLDPEKEYTITSEGGLALEKVGTGSQLVEYGITLRLPEKRSSELVFVEAREQ